MLIEILCRAFLCLDDFIAHTLVNCAHTLHDVVCCRQICPLVEQGVESRLPAVICLERGYLCCGVFNIMAREFGDFH